MAKQESLIELTPEIFQGLSDKKAAALAQAADALHKRQATYALLGMACGTLTLLACIGAFVYLAIQNHPKEAYVALGTAVLAMIGRIIKARL